MSNYHRMGNQPPLNVPQEHLHAEVERLRSENAALLKKRVENPTLFDIAVNQDDCPSVDLALHRASVAHKAGWTLANQAEVVLAKEVERLRAANAELRARLDDEVPHPTSLKAAWNDVRAIKAKLAWFEGIWPYVERLIADAEGEPLPAPSLSSLYDIHRYQDEYPKP